MSGTTLLDLRKALRPTIVSLTIFTLLLGLLYPAVTTLCARLVFAHQAEGSLIEDHGHVIGSELIAQPFDDPRYLWGRPSATAPFANNALSSTGTNWGPLHPALVDAVKARISALRTADPENRHPIPVDLVTASGSGLDPHVSPAAARYQAPRIARVRGVPEARIRAIIEEHVEGRQLGMLGEPRVNVLAVNRALDARLGTAR